MIRLIRFACMCTAGGPTITNAATRRCLSATPRHRAAPPSATSIHILRVRTCPARDDIIGGIAATTKAYYLYGWIMLHPSGAYVTFTQAEAESAVIAVYA